MNRVGYYAGNVEAFARWWNAFGALDEKIKASIAAGSMKQERAETPDVQVRRTSNGAFVLTIAGKTLSNVHDAQEALLPKAREVCEGKRPEFGVYTVDKLEKLASPQDTSGDLVTFKLDQEISCK